MSEGMFELVVVCVDVLFAAALAYISYKTHKIDSLEQRLQKSIETRIEETFTDIKRRLKEGDDDFEKLGERDQQAEVRFTKTIGDLKEFMRTTFASREDLQRHETAVNERHKDMEKELKKISIDVAVLANASGGHGHA